MIRDGKLFYVRGIVSVKHRSSSKIAAFTDLSDYVDWILSIQDEIDNKITQEKLAKFNEVELL